MSKKEKGMVAIIGGSGLGKSDLLEGTKKKVVTTEWGKVKVHVGKGFVFLHRHHSHPKDDDFYYPPHCVRYVAHAIALKSFPITACFLITSTGSLQPTIKPGTCVIADDFYLFNASPKSQYQDHKSHIVPELDKELRKTAIGCAQKIGFETLEKGTYASAPGPRFETRAEVRFLSTVADVVGMTAGHEIPLMCEEPKIPVALISMVDNWGNGIGKEPLTPEEYKQGVKQNNAKLVKLVQLLIDTCSS